MKIILNLLYAVLVGTIMMSSAISADNGKSEKPSPNTLPNFDKLWNYQDPKATEMSFRELIPKAKAAESIPVFEKTYNLALKNDQDIYSIDAARNRTGFP